MSIIRRGGVRREVRRRSHPGLFIVACFASLAGLGTFLLWLPVSHADGAVGVSDAFFTSFSAVTVTGLAVQDTSTAFTTFGQLVIMLLIQVGGLGIMTLAGFTGLVVSHRMSVRAGMLAGTEIGLTDLGPLRPLLSGLVKFVFVSEAVLATLLSVRFILEPSSRSTARSIFDGIFHAVSAFNNAGFSTFAGGLESYVDDWFVCLAIAAGFIVGGIGFPIIFELGRVGRRTQRWSLHTKVSLSVTAGLLAVGTVVIAALEWTNDATLGALGWPNRLLAAFFQSATARTAGFNTVPFEDLKPATWLIFILLMVVGANSASTGGGIKTTTFAVAIRSTIGQLRGDRDVTLFERRLPAVLQKQALSLVVMSLGTIGTAAFALAIVEPETETIRLLFEAASAFGTVGVSAAVTPTLGPLGRIIIVILMFVGRVGPITFGTAFLFRREARHYRFPEDDLMVG